MSRVFFIIFWVFFKVHSGVFVHNRVATQIWRQFCFFSFVWGQLIVTACPWGYNSRAASKSCFSYSLFHLWAMFAILKTEDAWNGSNRFPSENICWLIPLRHLCGDLLFDGDMLHFESFQEPERRIAQECLFCAVLKRLLDSCEVPRCSGSITCLGTDEGWAS